MAIERGEQAGQGGVGGELIAGVAQEQGAGSVSPSRSTSLSVRAPGAGSFGGSPRTVMTSLKPSIAARWPRSASVPAAFLRQGVSRLSRMASAGCAAQAAAIFASTSKAAPDAGSPRWVASRLEQRLGVRRGLKIDEEAPVLAEARDDPRIVGRRQRQRRLAHAERARRDNRPVLFEDRLDQFLEPLLAADHFRVGR